MQDRYAGDVGDFVKLGLLRAISPDRKLGLAWYRFPDEAHNTDGRHTDYLNQPARYAQLDPELFRHLDRVVANERKVLSLLPVLGNAISSDELVGFAAIPVRQRRDLRNAWFSRVLDRLSDCDLVFADPDNGIVDNDDKRKGLRGFGKQIPLSEVQALAQGRCAVIYHHNTHRPGGHDAEVDHWQSQFDTPSMAVRARAYSPRTFFVLNPDPGIRERVHTFCAKWVDLRVQLHEPAQ